MVLGLPSSASEGDFADNTNNNFKVRPPRKLVLEPGEWAKMAKIKTDYNKNKS